LVLLGLKIDYFDYQKATSLACKLVRFSQPGGGEKTDSIQCFLYREMKQLARTIISMMDPVLVCHQLSGRRDEKNLSILYIESEEVREPAAQIIDGSVSSVRTRFCCATRPCDPALPEQSEEQMRAAPPNRGAASIAPARGFWCAAG